MTPSPKAPDPVDPDAPDHGWRRRYHLVFGRMLRSGLPANAIASEDISMDDPATSRLWLRIDVVLLVVVLLAIVALVVAWLT